MSNNDATTENTANRLFSRIPQDKSSGVFRGTLGLSPDETVLVLAIPSIVAGAAVKYTGYGVGDVLIKWFVGVAFLYLVAQRTPHHMTPYALLARAGRFGRSRIRMPLLPGDARRETGVIDVDGDEADSHGVAERTDGTLFAIVEGEPRNTTRNSPADWADDASALRDQYDTEIAKAGADAQFQVSRTPPEGADVDSLASTVDDGAVRDDAQTFAAATASHTQEWEGGAGVMATDSRIIVEATPGEAADSRIGGVSQGILRASRGTREEQRRLLRNRVEAAEDVLASAADDVKALGPDELRETLRATWRPHDYPLPEGETATHDETVLWGPHGVDEHKDHVVLNPSDPESRDVVSSVWVSGWPVEPDPGFLADVLNAPGVRLEVSFHAGDRDRREKVDELDNEIKRIRRRATDLLSNRGARGNSGTQARDADALETDKADLRHHAQDTETEISEVSATLTVRASDADGVVDARDEIVSRLRRVGVTATPADGDQLSAFISTTPTGQDRLADVLGSRIGEFLSSLMRNASVELGVSTAFDMPSGAVGCLLPSVHGVRQDEDGVIYGMAAGGHPTLSDETPAGILQVAREALSAPHRYMMARSGWGKTYLESAQATEEMLRRRGADRLMILDIAENFDGVVETLGGGKVTFGTTTINPWAVGLEQGVDLVADLLDTFLRHNATDEERPSRANVRELVRETYDHVDADRPPVFEDFFDVLALVEDGEIDVTVRGSAGENERWSETATTLLTLLSAFQPEGEYGFMSPDVEAGESPTGDVDLSERVLLFDGNEFQDRGGAASGIMAVLYLSLAYRASDGDELVLCAVDEAHDVFRDAAEAGRFESMVRAGRNRGLCFDFLSQADEDFDADEARVIAKQAPVVVAGNLGQEANVEDVMSFGFPREEARQICGRLEMGESDTDYSEAVVSVEGDIYLVQIETDDLVGEMITYSEDDGEWREHVDSALLSTDLGSDTAQTEVKA